MEQDKYVDESWKDAVASEKQKTDDGHSAVSQPAPSAAEEGAVAEENVDPDAINFLAYITSLAYQSMIFLGEVPNPITEQVDKNLKQAKFIIDTLVLLRDKTKGNLTKQESDTLNSALYELQMLYVEASQKESAS